MKRMIVSSTDLTDLTKEQLQQRIYDLRPEVFDRCRKLSASFTRGGTSFEIYVVVGPQGGAIHKQYKFKDDAKFESDVNRFADMIAAKLDEQSAKKEARNKLNQELKASGKKLVSAQALVHSIIKSELGITPTFAYSDTHKSQYMLWSLPFTDFERRKINVKEGEKYVAKFQSVLDNIMRDYPDIHISSDLPLEGNVHRACFEIRTSGPNYVYDKQSGSYTPFNE